MKKIEKKIRLGGNDDKGTVYDCGKYIKREILPQHFKKSAGIYYLYKKKRLDKLGIVKTYIKSNQQSYVHQKHILTYPHEWTYSMFKDSLIFQLILVKKLNKIGLSLKDFLPSNVLFKHSKPVFVDFLSLIMTKDLNKEEWLYVGEVNHNRKPEELLIKNMLIPYLLIPLLAFALKDYKRGRNLLRYKACNFGNGIPKWSDLFEAQGVWNFRLIMNVVKLRLLSLLPVKDYLKTIDKYLEIIRSIDLSNENSGYLSYYEEKGENFSFLNKGNWRQKQKFVHGQLKKIRPKSVLDIGANTGWYSMLSEKMGASVIATEKDEAVIDYLYQKAKSKNLKILPLMLPFKDFLEKNSESNFIPPTNRLRSDLVLCLALLHHLVLGEGIDEEIIVKILSKLSIKACILEFVDLTDEKIRSQPDFFPKLGRKDFKKYNLKRLIFLGKKYFRSVSVHPSTESSRKLILLKNPI